MAITTLYRQNHLRDDYFIHEQELRIRNEYLMKEAKQRTMQELYGTDELIKQKPVEKTINKTILLLGD